MDSPIIAGIVGQRLLEDRNQLVHFPCFFRPVNKIGDFEASLDLEPRFSLFLALTEAFAKIMTFF